ncbi:MAG TPA: NIPSNAP family protein [Blastocatellia bacterium]|nr:NIPSNAP family protein [Blastocatellia bacterium]
MITLCIQYEIDHHKLSAFEQYAKNWPEPIRRCGGKLIGYFLPTKLAGKTNTAIALISFADLTAYERYREALMKDPDAIANVKHADESGCIIFEDRSFMRQIPE